MTRGIEKTLSGVRRRLRTQIFCIWTARGLAFGALVALLFIALSKFVRIDFDLIRTAVSLIIICGASGMIAGLLKPLTTFDAAFACDIHLGLKERLTSAIEFRDAIDTNPLIPALVADADRYSKLIKPSRDFPLRIPRELLYSIIFVAMTIGLFFVPPWQYVIASEEKKAELDQIKAQAETVREIARELTINPNVERSDFAKEIADQLNELAADMELGTLTRREALERLNKIEEQIVKSQEESGYNELRQQLYDMAKALVQSEEFAETAEALAYGDIDKAQSALEKLASDLENGRVPAENLGNLADALDQAAKSLAGNPDMADTMAALEAARDALDEASRSLDGGGSLRQNMDPESTAKALIEAIKGAIPELDKLDVPDEIREQAKQIMEQVRDDLQNKLDSGNITQQDVRDAQEKLQEARKLLEQAGADLSGNQSTPEETAQQLMEEARNLAKEIDKLDALDSATREQYKKAVNDIADKLEKQIEQGSCSQSDNSQARQELNEIYDKLDEELADEIAKKLIEEAEKLEQLANSASDLDPATRSEVQSTCQSVKQELENQLQSGSCSAANNEEARRKLDEVREKLEQESEACQNQMPGRTDCSGGQCQRPGGQQSSGQSGSQQGSQLGGLNGLFN
ncbi:MAG TPA: hypothetical protein ENN67_04645, partial [Firmicutes bacterium]|nr:hypothetical protein [Bacillota bacterium]